MQDIAADTPAIVQNFVLRTGATIRGRATSAAIEPGVGWAPSEFAPYQELLFVRGTGIAEDGSFVLTDLPPGRVALRVADGSPVALEGLKEGETRDAVVVPASK